MDIETICMNFYKYKYFGNQQRNQLNQIKIQICATTAHFQIVQSIILFFTVLYKLINNINLYKPYEYLLIINKQSKYKYIFIMHC